jgi:hypothetical protein
MKKKEKGVFKNGIKLIEKKNYFLYFFSVSSAGRPRPSWPTSSTTGSPAVVAAKTRRKRKSEWLRKNNGKSSKKNWIKFIELFSTSNEISPFPQKCFFCVYNL